MLLNFFYETVATVAPYFAALKVGNVSQMHTFRMDAMHIV